MLPPEALSFRGFHCQYNIWQENQVVMPFRRGNLLVFVVPENLDADFGGGRDVAFGAQGLEFFGESPGKFHDTREAHVKAVVADIEDAP